MECETGERLRSALDVADALLSEMTASLGRRVVVAGRIDRQLLDRDQHAAHCLTWFATYVQVLRSLEGWWIRLKASGTGGVAERAIVDIVLDEYLAQMLGGIPMSQVEAARPSDLDVGAEALRPLADLVSRRSADQRRESRTQLASLLAQDHGRATLEETGLPDDLAMLRDHFRSFVNDRIAPAAHQWHLGDELIPQPLVEELAALGVFGLTIPESYGGAGLGKVAMCVVSEELSRGYIGVGSLGTRSEIAAELILNGGTDVQKSRWLPAIASGTTLPTAVFTEPDTGSDLGSIQTRAGPVDGGFSVVGNKTWITHAARADLMMILVRTEAGSNDHRGLSMLVGEKLRGTDIDPFPVPGLRGSEIEVIGYRGMKEYELALDGFFVPADNLLGGTRGRGFVQLMSTFESARIQTAARAIGVAQSALDVGLGYALERRQFGDAIYTFPRVRDKLVLVAAELAAVRQLTYDAARLKDAGGRCDMEAGMAKLLAARTAWAAADCTVQIHGGNGFAMEYAASRILCDARVLSIFEGAAEIQAHIIARRLLEAAMSANAA